MTDDDDIIEHANEREKLPRNQDRLPTRTKRISSQPNYKEGESGMDDLHLHAFCFISTRVKRDLVIKFPCLMVGA